MPFDLDGQQEVAHRDVARMEAEIAFWSVDAHWPARLEPSPGEARQHDHINILDPPSEDLGAGGDLNAILAVREVRPKREHVLGEPLGVAPFLAVLWPDHL